jgi:hypothetical protein
VRQHSANSKVTSVRSDDHWFLFVVVDKCVRRRKNVFQFQKRFVVFFVPFPLCVMSGEVMKQNTLCLQLWDELIALRKERSCFWLVGVGMSLRAFRRLSVKWW